MTDWLINSKLRPPVEQRDLVERQRIAERLDCAFATQLCVVHAPAGYGKTSALAQWQRSLSQREIPCAWVSLDEHDTTLHNFLTYLSAAGREGGFPAFATLAGPGQGAVSDSELAAAVAGALARDSVPRVLVLDDFQRAESLAVLEFLQGVVSSRAPALTIVIGTRQLPRRLTLADLRIHGALLELGQEELRFDLEEVQRLFADLLPEAGLPPWLNEVYQRTEGWPVGLLTVRRWTLEGEPIEATLARLSGRDTDLADYFLEQVFAAFPEQVRRFLLATSILERVSGELGSALCPDVDAWEVLRELQERDAFLQSLDREKYWFRYHQLFSEFLEERLRRSADLDSASLHQRASRWFRENGYVAEAVQHALASGDNTTCASLLESMGGWQYALQGHLGVVQSVLKRLSGEELSFYPRLWFARVYLSVRIGHYQAGEEDFRRLEETLLLGRDESDPLRAEGELIRALTNRYRDQPVTRAAIAALERLADRLPPEDSVLLAVRANLLCPMYREMSEYAECDRVGHDAIALYKAMGARYGEAFMYYHLGLASQRQARFREAVERFEQGMAMGRDLLGEDSDPVAIGRVFLAQVLFETGEITEASALLDGAVQHVERADAWMEVYLAAYSTQMRIALEAGDLQLLERISARARGTSERRKLPRLAQLIDLQRREMASVLGGETQSRAGDSAPDLSGIDAISDAYLKRIAARELLTRGDVEAACDFLREAADGARQRGDFLDYLGLLLMLSGAEWRRGQEAEALACFEAVLAVAVVENAVRLFIDERALLLPVVEAVFDGSAQTGTTPARMAFLRKLRAAMLATDDDRDGAEIVLSPREIDVLRSLMMGDSNREIAEARALSVNTVKFHLKNIFSKLGASSRDEAVAFAIRDGLI